jgi:hypothetical protein
MLSEGHDVRHGILGGLSVRAGKAMAQQLSAVELAR